MKSRQDFETAVATYALEVKSFAAYSAKLGGVILVWLIVLKLSRPMSLPTWKFALLVVVCPLVIVLVGVFRGRKLDLAAKALGLRCPACRRWFTSHHMADRVRKKGVCPNCQTVIFTG